MDGRAEQRKYHGYCDAGGRRNADQGHKLVKALLVVAAILAVSDLTYTDEPLIDHQPVVCSLPEKNPRICTYVADDGEVKKARVYFRAEGQEAFYWSEMAFDGIQYCATLPAAKHNVRNVDYYIWAIDDSFESQRTRTFTISVAPDTPCEYPVFDEDPERASNLTVYATSPDQGDSIKDFEEEGIVRFVAARRRKK